MINEEEMLYTRAL